MELRNYQIKAINSLRQSFRDGHKRPILRLDCGAGKTVISAWITRSAIQKNHNVLFLVHLQELKQQTIDTFKKFGIEIGEHLRIEMIITAGNKMKDFEPDLIIADECNFALSKSWLKVFNRFPKAQIIGLSATPIRLSGEPMGAVFDDLIEIIDAKELIKLGNLCDYDYYAPKLNFDIKDVKTRAGDFQAEMLEQILSKPKIYGDVLSYYKKFCQGRKTICYCTTISHSVATAEEFKKAGYNAVHFDGNTPEKKRKQIVEEFKNGKIEILCNCNLISFGFDVPDCDCVLLLRPTQSLALYIQQSMRCLRGRPGKRAIILDFVGNCHRFGLPTDKQEYTLTGKKKCDNKNAEPEVHARQCNQCFKTYSGTSPICPYCGFNNGKTRAEIKQDEKAELERIETIKKFEKKKEVAKAKSLEALIEIGKERGYKNPTYWAKMIINSRESKKKHTK